MTTKEAEQLCEDAIHQRSGIRWFTNWKDVALELYRTRFKLLNENIRLKEEITKLKTNAAHIRDAAAS